MRYLIGGLLLILAALSWRSGLMRSQLEQVMLATIGLTGILMLLPPPRPRAPAGLLRSLRRVYLVGRGLMAVPIGAVGAFALHHAYITFSAGAAQSQLTQNVAILIAGVICFGAGAWLLVTSARAW